MPLIVEALSLPNNLPHPKAIESFRDNLHGYDPEFWEVFYRTYRYLSRITESELRERYVALHRNLRTLTSTDRDKIPIQSFLSSWYWHKKEHQTQLEFALRDLELPIVPKARPFQAIDKTPILRPRSPNSGDVLYRYGDVSYLEPMLYEGKIRLAAAGYYRDIELGEVRSDDELNKHSYSPGKYIKIINPDGSESPIIGDLKRTKSAPDYYALCMSCDWDIDLLDDFGANCCVVIHDTDEFASRLDRAAKQVIGISLHTSPEHRGRAERSRAGTGHQQFSLWHPGREFQSARPPAATTKTATRPSPSASSAIRCTLTLNYLCVQRHN